MRRALMVTAVLVLAAPSLAIPALACGDKFLMVGQGVRFSQAYAALYPAAILLYARAGRPASPAILDPRFQATLTRAGHRLEVVTREDALAEALQRGRFDFVFADIADVDAIKLQADRTASQPNVLPLFGKLTKADAAAVKARYGVELKASDRPAHYLSTIDDQMHARAKQRAAQKRS